MLRDDISGALKAALLSNQPDKAGTLRMIMAAIKNRDIGARTGGGDGVISDEEILTVLQSMIKQRRESIEMYGKGNRPELAAKEQGEIDVISAFLPAQMTPEEMRAAIEAAVKETEAGSLKDMGKVMGVLKSKHAGKMDFSAASAMIKEALG